MIKKKGFNLIEVVIIVAIITVMLSVLFANLGNNDETKKIDAAVREVEATIRLAQNYALSGKDAAGGCSYRFFHERDDITPSNATGYGIDGCNTINYKLEGGVYFHNDGNLDDDIEFTIPNGDTVGNLRIVLNVLSGGSTISRTICVNDGGAMSILEGNVSCGF